MPCISCTPAFPPCLVQGWQYSADNLRAELNVIVTENKDILAVADGVKEVCLKHGTKLSSDGSKRAKCSTQGEKGRLVAYLLRCVHGMPNRQAHEVSASGERSTLLRRRNL